MNHVLILALVCVAFFSCKNRPWVNPATVESSTKGAFPSDYKVDASSVSANDVGALISAFKKVEDNGKGEVSLKQVFSVFGLTAAQIKQVADSSSGPTEDLQKVKGQCYEDKNGRLLFCEFRKELKDLKTIYLGQLSQPVKLEFYRKQVKFRVRLFENQKGFEFCSVEGLKLGAIWREKLNGAKFQLLKSAKGAETVAGFLDIGSGGTYAVEKKLNCSKLRGVAAQNAPVQVAPIKVFPAEGNAKEDDAL